MERKLKRQQRTVGAIVKIPLEKGFHAYARILEDNFAFYDIRTKKELPADKIVSTAAVIFFATVHDDAVIKGYWQKIGKVLPVEKYLSWKQPFYTQDRLNPTKYTIYHNGKEKPATRQQCIGLDYLMVWTYEEMEERLRDFFARRKNKFVEKMHRAEMYSTTDNNEKHNKETI